MPVSCRSLKLPHAQCLLLESSDFGKSEPKVVYRQPGLLGPQYCANQPRCRHSDRQRIYKTRAETGYLKAVALRGNY